MPAYGSRRPPSRHRRARSRTPAEQAAVERTRLGRIGDADLEPVGLTSHGHSFVRIALVARLERGRRPVVDECDAGAGPLRRGRSRARTRAAPRCRRSGAPRESPARGTDPDPVTERLLERLLRAQQCGLLVGMGDHPGPGVAGSLRAALRFAHRPSGGDRVAGESAAGVAALGLQDRAPVASVSSPSERRSRTSSGRSSSRIRFEIAGRARPERRASSSLERPRSSTSAAQARASSTGFRSSRTTFSISAVCRRCGSSSSRSSAGTVSRPASRAARQRRSWRSARSGRRRGPDDQRLDHARLRDRLGEAGDGLGSRRRRG